MAPSRALLLISYRWPKHNDVYRKMMMMIYFSEGYRSSEKTCLYSASLTNLTSSVLKRPRLRLPGPPTSTRHAKSGFSSHPTLVRFTKIETQAKPLWTLGPPLGTAGLSVCRTTTPTSRYYVPGGRVPYPFLGHRHHSSSRDAGLAELSLV
jgi:hypothetical protein